MAQNEASAAMPGPCGQVVSLATHQQTRTRYSLVMPPTHGALGAPVTLALLVGGSGHLDLDEQGCPRLLRGNSLVRALPLFEAAGFGTALIDAPSDHHQEDGLAGFRSAAAHAQDLGQVMANLRQRTAASVWLIGTSRGAISATNAASRLSGASAPDGLVLTSALMAAPSRAQKAWVMQSIFDLDLAAIRMPLLFLGHALDSCPRSPADRMQEAAARTQSARRQVVTMQGGPGSAGLTDLQACEGRSPHGFIDQEAEMVGHIIQFIRAPRS